MKPADRDPQVQAFFVAMHGAIRAEGRPGDPGPAIADRIFAALDRPAATTTVSPARLPACAHLNTAIENAEAGPPAAAGLARALGALAPRLEWIRRAGTAKLGQDFADGHANAYIAGPSGLEQRSDVMVGVSLMAPNLRYPDHDHPPEEVYLVLSPGEWRNDDMDWWEPGIGGIVHNRPGIVHAMRSGDAPLLAAWALWVG